MNRHRVRVPGPRLTSSSREIQACGFAQPEYQLPPAIVRSPFLRQRCGPDAGSAPEHKCRASRDGPFETSKMWSAVSLRRKQFEQRPGFLQIEGVEPLGEPAVNRSKQFASL